MAALKKCSLCENMEDPRFRAEANGRVYPLCDGCGGPETSMEAVTLFGKLAALPLPEAVPMPSVEAVAHGQTRTTVDGKEGVHVFGAYGHGSGGTLFSVSFPHDVTRPVEGMSEQDIVAKSSSPSSPSSQPGSSSPDASSPRAATSLVPMGCENCERLRAERNRLVEATELGAVSERLEEDNAATDAATVRSAMHELTRLRAAPSSGIPGLKVERYGHIRGIGEERITFKVEVPASHAERTFAAIEAMAAPFTSPAEEKKP